jgi:uracil-DNA glycosylase
MAALLHDLKREIEACRVCASDLPHEPRPVVHLSSSARLCIVGQAPGTRVHKTGIPFNDPSGDRLRAWMGITRETFYDEGQIAIVPMGFCFPGLDAKGGDLPPRKECAPLWRERVFEQLESVSLTLLVGGYAQKWHLKGHAKKTLTETVAAWRDYLPAYLPLPHPSWRNNGWIKKNPWFEDDVLPELRKRVGCLVDHRKQEVA